MQLIKSIAFSLDHPLYCASPKPKNSKKLEIFGMNHELLEPIRQAFLKPHDFYLGQDTPLGIDPVPVEILHDYLDIRLIDNGSAVAITLDTANIIGPENGTEFMSEPEHKVAGHKIEDWKLGFTMIAKCLKSLGFEMEPTINKPEAWEFVRGEMQVKPQRYAYSGEFSLTQDVLDRMERALHVANISVTVGQQRRRISALRETPPARLTHP